MEKPCFIFQFLGIAHLQIQASPTETAVLRWQRQKIQVRLRKTLLMTRQRCIGRLSGPSWPTVLLPQMAVWPCRSPFLRDRSILHLYKIYCPLPPRLPRYTGLLLKQCYDAEAILSIRNVLTLDLAGELATRQKPTRLKVELAIYLGVQEGQSIS